MDTKTIWYCDEDGFSGGVKNTTSLSSYLSQPLFVTSGLHFTSKEQETNVKKYWEQFLDQHNLNSELKQKKLFSKESNDVLKEFISFVSCLDCWEASVIDKKFKLYTDAIEMPFEIPNSEIVFVTAQKNLKNMDLIVNKYFDFMHGGITHRDFYNFLLSNVDYGHLKDSSSYELFEYNYDTFLKRQKYANFDHIDSLFNMLTLDMDPIENWMFTQNLIFDKHISDLEIFYDKNEEFSKLKPEDYYAAHLIDNITFVDSKDNSLIQLADCIGRLILTFSKYKLYEEKAKNAEEIFAPLEQINLHGIVNLFLTLDDKDRFNFYNE